MSEFWIRREIEPSKAPKPKVKKTKTRQVMSLADRKKELMAFFTQWAKLACKSDGAALSAVSIAKGRISQLTDDAGVGSVVPVCNPPTEKNQRQRRLEPSRVYAPTSKSHKRLSNSNKRKKKEKKQKERDDALKSP